MPDPRPLPRTLDQLSRAEVEARIETLDLAIDDLWVLTDSQGAMPFECIGQMKACLIHMRLTVLTGAAS